MDFGVWAEGVSERRGVYAGYGGGLARGVYGQRQPGVQMVRIKLPFGKVTFKQLLRIADVSDEYASHNLHLTTRQDIQIHYVSLDRTPQLWAELERDDITLREACGNTVRNVTASPTAGIDPKEPFDVSPYAHATFEFFLRNPICQEMGRKFKISFSSSSPLPGNSPAGAKDNRDWRSRRNEAEVKRKVKFW